MDWKTGLWGSITAAVVMVIGWVHHQLGVAMYLLLSFMAVDSVLKVMVFGWNYKKFKRAWAIKSAELLIVLVMQQIGRWTPELTNGVVSSLPALGTIAAAGFAWAEVRSILLSFRRLGGEIPPGLADVVDRIKAAKVPESEPANNPKDEAK